MLDTSFKLKEGDKDGARRTSLALASKASQAKFLDSRTLGKPFISGTLDRPPGSKSLFRDTLAQRAPGEGGQRYSLHLVVNGEDLQAQRRLEHAVEPGNSCNSLLDS